MRLTTRMLMTIVAMVAVALSVRHWCERRSVHFRELAARHYNLSVDSQDRRPGFCIVRWTSRSVYHETMMAKYDRAALSPWLPVTPDPTPPPWPANMPESKGEVHPRSIRPEIRLSQRGLGINRKNVASPTTYGR